MKKLRIPYHPLFLFRLFSQAAKPNKIQKKRAQTVMPTARPMLLDEPPAKKRPKNQDTAAPTVITKAAIFSQYKASLHCTFYPD
jgi:hypothetical protein